MREQKDVELTSSHKYIKNTSTCGIILTKYLLNAGGGSQKTKKCKKDHHVTRQDESKDRNQDRTCPLGRSYEEEKFPHLEQPLLQWGDQPRQKGSFRGSEVSTASGLRQAKQRNQHRGSLPAPCAPQSKMHDCWYAQGLSAHLQPQKADPGRRLGLSEQRQLQWLKCGPIQVRTGGLTRRSPSPGPPLKSHC